MEYLDVEVEKTEKEEQGDAVVRLTKLAKEKGFAKVSLKGESATHWRVQYYEPVREPKKTVKTKKNK